LSDIPQHLMASPGSSTKSSSSRTTNNRRVDWDDDFNQDPYGESSGRVFGSGVPPKSNTTSRRSSPPPPRTGSYSSPTVPPSSKGMSQPPAQPVKPKTQQFKPGDRVRHGVFGYGLVLKSEMEQSTEFVEVQFEGKVGKKRLSLDFAKLEKV